MKIYEIVKGKTGIEALRLADRPDPKPGRGQVLVRVRATSLNFRDLMVLQGVYPGMQSAGNLIPLSDGAGEVAEVGEGVTRFKKGDRVAGTFFQVWVNGPPHSGPAALGGPGVDGMLAQYVVLHEDGLVAVPESLSLEEAASLPCAAVTAWNGLMVSGKPIGPGDTVLVLGTGGVSMFALQFARAAGARVIVTSSSDAKLDRAAKHGAADLINYKKTPDWGKEVLRVTGGRGVDCVVEVGGSGTLAKSFQSVGYGGKVALIGLLSGREGDTTPHPLMFKGASLHGIFVGNRAMFEDMLDAMVVNRIKPIIDTVFEFDHAADAYRHQIAGAHFGKVVVRV
jgi:NADPH:quinone reductase-like Zn-dependent oxidoreductase